MTVDGMEAPINSMRGLEDLLTACFIGGVMVTSSVGESICSGVGGEMKIEPNNCPFGLKQRVRQLFENGCLGIDRHFRRDTYINAAGWTTLLNS